MGREAVERYAVRHGIDLTDLAEEMYDLLAVMTAEEAEQAVDAWSRSVGSWWWTEDGSDLEVASSGSGCAASTTLR